MPNGWHSITDSGLVTKNPFVIEFQAVRRIIHDVTSTSGQEHFLLLSASETKKSLESRKVILVQEDVVTSYMILWHINTFPRIIDHP